MKKTNWLFSAVILGTLLLPGCANITMVRTKELRIVQSKIDSLRIELVTLQKTMYEEQKTQGDMIRGMKASQQQRLDDIYRNVSNIGTNLNENQKQLSLIDKKTSALEATIVADSLADNAREEEIKRLFNVCMTDFNAGRFDLAISGLNDLVSQYPESPVAAESEYWIAECSYAKRAYGQAEKDYISYIRKYPEGSKLCVALYKLGLAYGKQNKGKSKNMVWKKALEQCPDAPEVQVIKNQM